MKLRDILIATAFLYSLSVSANSINFRPYIKRFQELETQQKTYFDKLRFKLSPKVIKVSLSYKLLLVDQFGEEWMFKGGQESSMDGAVAVYRLFNFVGVPTPEIHYKTLIINGEKVEGSLQRYLPTKDGNNFFLSKLNSLDHEYLAKNHALAWLSLNNHTHMKQFIYLKEPVNDLSIMRIDNSVNWYTLGSDQLNTFYYSPILIHAQNPGYYSFWNDYLVADVMKKNLAKKEIINHGITENDITTLKRREIKLDLNQLYAWVNLIKLIPDDYYSHFFLELSKNNFVFSGNNSYISPWLQSAESVALFDEKNFIKNIVRRKNNILNDFGNFYGRLATLKSLPLRLEQKKSQEIFNDLNKRINLELEKIKEKTKNIGLHELEEQEEIIAPISLKTHTIVKMTMRMAFSDETSDRVKIIDQIIGQLNQQKSATKYELEKEPITNAIKNFELFKNSQLVKSGTKEEIVMSMVNYHKFFNADSK